jgi:hypothetical protein
MGQDSVWAMSQFHCCCFFICLYSPIRLVFLQTKSLIFDFVDLFVSIVIVNSLLICFCFCVRRCFLLLLALDLSLRLL